MDKASNLIRYNEKTKKPAYEFKLANPSIVSNVKESELGAPLFRVDHAHY